MSSPKFDTALDDLFRQALAPVAEQAAPAEAWDRLTRAVQIRTAERTVWETLLEHLLLPRHSFSAPWNRITSWIHSFVTYPPSSTQLTYWGADGKCHTSRFAGGVFPQILDLRRAS